ncbi:hypothetical protein GCM10023149_07770 [Mucilaginibacter gynuensis]|uniref:IPT/TIG domain-containing protein n=2 Tax=Mucilaginibacter gynuensis TaxID=1302236 RepID=A0ABP8FWG1_9SPHI
MIGACKKDKVEPQAAAFKINNYFPNSGNAGTLVTIEGEGFAADITQYSASIAGQAAEVVSATAGYIVVMVPNGTGNGDITVKYNGKDFNVGKYTYQSLSVKAISPRSGPVGTNIRISGEGFADKDKPAEVTVNGNKASIISLTDTLIIATVPDKTNSGPVEVKVQDKSSTGPVFKVQALYDISPKTGGKGTRITLKGSGFETELGKNQVSFSGKAGQVVQSTDTEIVVIAPEGITTGRVGLKIDATVIEGPVFTLVDPPSITEVTPLSGPAGTEMKIGGTGYSLIPGETKVSINDKDVPIKSISISEIALVVPENTGSGKVKVTVNDQVVVGPTFTEQTLGITKFTPEAGTGGAVITITGTGFSTVAANNIVTFNGVNAHVNSASATQLVVVAPPNVTSGVIKVSVNGKEAFSAKPFVTQGISTLTNTLPAGVHSICAGRNGEVYAADRARNNILRVAPDGTISVFAGSANGESGDAPGLGTAARFTQPVGIVMDTNGNLFVIEFTGNIKKITPGGDVSMFVRNVTYEPTGSAIDINNKMYVGTAPNSFSGVFIISPNGSIAMEWDWYADPEGRVGIDADGKVYASDINGVGRHGIGAGSYYDLIADSFAAGHVDGSYTEARFGVVGNMVWNNKDMILVCDPDNNAVRTITPAARRVGTLFKAGKGYQDGSFSEVKFGDLSDISIASNGVIYILDKANKAIRKVSL